MKKFPIAAMLLFFCTLVRAQETEIAGMEKDFRAYQSAHLQEKIYVQTDKTVYLAGETIWFKLYTLLEQSKRMSPISRVAYVELGNSEVKKTLQQKINLDAGVGSGLLQLPANWPSGNYTFRVYTSWMKNFPEEFFYTQTIAIISPLYGPAVKPAADSSSTDSTRPVKIPRFRQDEARSSLQFFPEGGNLLYGVQTKLAFRSVDEKGKERSCVGFVVNQKNDTLVRFGSPATALHPGTGHFDLTVPPGDSLNAYEYRDGKQMRVAFPVAASSGYSLRLSEIDSSSLTFSVNAPVSENNKPVFLLAHTRQIIKNIQSNRIQNGKATFTIARSLLEDGISVFTLFDLDHRPVCERLYFSVPHKSALTVSVAEPRYENRNAVSVRVSVNNESGAPASGDLSLAVIKIDSLTNTVERKNIFSWYYLSSELKGSITNMASYFGMGVDSVEAADDLMLTQGWRRFSWDKIFRNKAGGFRYLPEEEGPVLSAHAENRLTNKPAAGTSFLLSFPGKQFQFSTATADSDGTLLFTARSFSGTTAGVIVPANLKDSNFRVDADPAYSELPFPAATAMPMLSKTFASVLTERALGLQIENAYRKEEKKKLLPGLATDSVPFYGAPDRSYHLANYIRYPTMEEVLREFVEDVRVRRDGKSFHFRVMNRLFKTFLDEDPMILLDGVPVSDPGKIMQLDPMKLSDVDIVSHRFFKGSASFSGLISFRSIDGDLGQTALDASAVVVDFEGLQQQREFYAPAYTDSAMLERPIPDFRTTIAWIPRLVVAGNGVRDVQFYTSDVSGHFAVIAEGVSLAGNPLSGLTFFDVGKK